MVADYYSPLTKATKLKKKKIMTHPRSQVISTNNCV